MIVPVDRSHPEHSRTPGEYIPERDYGCSSREDTTTWMPIGGRVHGVPSFGLNSNSNFSSRFSEVSLLGSSRTWRNSTWSGIFWLARNIRPQCFLFTDRLWAQWAHCFRFSFNQRRRFNYDAKFDTQRVDCRHTIRACQYSPFKCRFWRWCYIRSQVYFAGEKVRHRIRLHIALYTANNPGRWFTTLFQR